jgi:hypothetical protein
VGPSCTAEVSSLSRCRQTWRQRRGGRGWTRTGEPPVGGGISAPERKTFPIRKTESTAPLQELHTRAFSAPASPAIPPSIGSSTHRAACSPAATSGSLPGVPAADGLHPRLLSCRPMRGEETARTQRRHAPANSNDAEAWHPTCGSLEQCRLPDLIENKVHPTEA